MPDDRARRTHTIFMRALEVDTAERWAFVEAACTGDQAMQQRVERLIRAIDQSAGYLEVPALGTRSAGSVPAIAPDGRRISVQGYRVVRVIGIGGMATVYEAMQEQPERRVALKVMSRAFASASAVRRFRYETEVLARLHHPGIAQIFEAGMCEDGDGHPVPFFAMECVDGARTLTAWASEKALPLRERLLMFAGVCDAVQHGHQFGVIHRDLKPANILVGVDGRSKVIDFGVARSTDRENPITMRADVGQLIGTLNSMSPEQCAGDGAVDVRADVYSLGVILYELLAGREPYDLSRVTLPAAIRIIREEHPPRLSQFAPETRGDLEAIVARAMSKDPEARYTSAGALAADVRRFLDHQPVEASLPTLVHHARLFARRHRVLVVSGAALVCILILASVLISIFGYRAAQESRRRFAAEQAALAERDTALRQAYIASVGGAIASYQLGDGVQARRRLSTAPAEYRNFEWSLASAFTERGERIIRAHDDMIFAFATSIDGQRGVSGTRNGAVAVWELSSGMPLMSASDPEKGGIHAVALDGDGRRMYAGFSDGSIREWDVETGMLSRVIGRHGARVLRLALSPTGALASASASGEGGIWDLERGILRRTFDDQPGGVRGVAFSSDGSHLLTWGPGGSIWIRSGDGEPTGPQFEFGGSVELAAFSPDGRTIAAGGAEGRFMMWDAAQGALLHDEGTPPWNRTIRALSFTPDSKWLTIGQGDVTYWNVETGARRWKLVGHEDAISGLAHTPAGDQLVTASWDGTIRIWDLDPDRSTGPLYTLAGHEGQALCAAYSPDGALIASSGRDDVIRIWDPLLGLMLSELRGHDADVYSVAFSPDSMTLVSASEDRTARLWSMEDGSHLGTLGPNTDQIWTTQFSPDGLRIATGGEEGVIRIWDARSRAKLLEFRAHDLRILQLAYSPDGATLASASRDGTAALWDAASGAPLHHLRQHAADVFAVVFSHDGARLYTGSRDRTVGVWDTRTGQLLESLDAQGHFVTTLAITPDATRLVAGSWFGEAILWDLATHDLVTSFKAYNSAIRSIMFSPDGSSLLCGGHDGTLHHYDARPRAVQAALRADAQADMAAASALLEQEHSDVRSVKTETSEAEVEISDEVRQWMRKLRLMRSVENRSAS